MAITYYYGTAFAVTKLKYKKTDAMLPLISAFKIFLTLLVHSALKMEK